MRLAILSAICSCSFLMTSPAGAAPTIVTPGVALIQTNYSQNPLCVAYNPIDDLPYTGDRTNVLGGVYRLNTDGTRTKIASGYPGGIGIDPHDGDIYFSEDYGGDIFRTAFGSTGRSVWVSGFGDGVDDDPAGIAFVPDNYTGTAVTPGAALSTDAGYGSPLEVWEWSPDMPEGEVRLAAANGTTHHWVDIAVNDTRIVIVDSGYWGLLEMGDQGVVTPIATEVNLVNATSDVFDPVTGELYVALQVTGNSSIVRVNLDTGAVTTIINGFDNLSWGSIDVSSDGSRLFAADPTADTVYTFHIPDPSIVFGDLDGNGVFDAFDVDDFELALADRETYLATHPDIDPDVVGDFDGSGALDAFDVAGFESALASAGSHTTIPEPMSLSLWALGMITLARRARR